MEIVTIVHPDLPGREVEVPAESLPHHERAGWQRKRDKTPVDTPKAAKPAEKKE